MNARKAKALFCGVARASGVLDRVGRSLWRRSRLLILCYHGVSTEDEHLWNPALYVRPDTFRRRLEILHQGSFNVLPLGDAITRLYAGNLPERAVVLTFDDGHFDFQHIAWPILKSFRLPSTVYLTTYHCDHNMPIFGLIISYMMWKADAQELDLSPYTGKPTLVDLRSPGARKAALADLLEFAKKEDLSAAEKNDLASRIALQTGLDFSDIIRRRTLHLLSPKEVKALARAGVDFQMHTHRHRSPGNKELFLEEIHRNASRIAELTGLSPTHFCYPNGQFRSDMLPWLRAEGIASATTCESGLATRGTDPLLLPRLLDHDLMSDAEFEAWLTGFALGMPRRHYPAAGAPELG